MIYGLSNVYEFVHELYIVGKTRKIHPAVNNFENKFELLDYYHNTVAIRSHLEVLS